MNQIMTVLYLSVPDTFYSFYRNISVGTKKSIDLIPSHD